MLQLDPLIGESENCVKTCEYEMQDKTNLFILSVIIPRLG